MHFSYSSLPWFHILLVFHKVLVFESLLSISETFVCSMMALQLKTTSPRCSSAANFVCRDFNIFKIKNVSLSHIFK
jgi:hypothetical protein